MSTTDTALHEWIRTALKRQIRLNEALATIGLLSNTGSVDPEQIIAEAAAPLEGAEEITGELIDGVIAEMQRQNEAHLIKVAEAMGIISRIRVVLPTQG
jgi:hypothetical protein